jgi:nucleoside-diphosphate-sugar epimerase
MEPELDTKPLNEKGWKAQISLEEGLRQTVEYFLNRQGGKQ